MLKFKTFLSEDANKTSVCSLASARAGNWFYDSVLRTFTFSSVKSKCLLDSQSHKIWYYYRGKRDTSILESEISFALKFFMRRSFIRPSREFDCRCILVCISKSIVSDSRNHRRFLWQEDSPTASWKHQVAFYRTRNREAEWENEERGTQRVVSTPIKFAVNAGSPTIALNRGDDAVFQFPSG